MFNIKLLLITLYLITIFNVILTANNLNENCEDIQCPENNTETVCVYDKDAICFIRFPSKCVMERMQCIFNKDYMIFIDDYCEMQFLSCKNPQPFVQSPPEDGTTEGIGYNEIPEENMEVIFKNEADEDLKVKSKESEESNKSNSSESKSNEKP